MLQFQRLYGGEGKLVSTDECLVFYGHDYVFDACKQQGLTFHFESLSPICSARLMAILLLHFELVIICLEKEQIWGVG